MAEVLLEVKGLHTYYGTSHILHGVELVLHKGETLALMGRNGMGKTTLLKSILGLVPPRGGTVIVRGLNMTGALPHTITRAGIAYVPAGRGIFENLSAFENLVMSARPGYQGRHDWTLARVLKTFPPLTERLHHGGGQLSGGEQQMLSIGRALMTNPDLLIMDEATEGLAPLVAAKIWSTIRTVREAGVAVIIVDKNFSTLSKAADQVAILVKGRIEYNGPCADLLARPDLQRQYLGI